MTESQMAAGPLPIRRTPLIIGTLLWILAIASAVFLFWNWSNRNAVVMPPQEQSTSDDRLSVAEFELTDRSGQTVTKEDLAGHPTVVAFIFTRCAGRCVQISTYMKQLQERFADTPLRLVSISVDPKYDNQQILTRYADTFQADKDQWLFLTGEQDEIHQLILKSFRLPVAENTGANRKSGFEFAHSLKMVLLNPKGEIVGKYSVTQEQEMIGLRRDIEKQLEMLKSDE